MEKEFNYLSWNQLGIFPAPSETCADFEARGKLSLNWKKESQKFFSPYIPPLFDEALNLLEKMYDCRPEWIPCTLSKEGLLPWHGAATILVETSLHPSPLPVIQYPRPSSASVETISHELVHGTRCAFNEPFFEEFFAYQTSPKAWRKHWGPLVQSPKEALLFAGLSTLAPTLMAAELFVPFSLESWGIASAGALLACAGYGVVRLQKKQRVYREVLEKLGTWTEKPRALILRMSDEEIYETHRTPKQELPALLKRWKQQHFRWELFAEAYESRPSSS